MTTHYTNTQRGFTLVETLVAIFIFASSIVVMLTVTSGGISEVSVLRNKITASYLAQEGIELVRNSRDRNILNEQNASLGWQQFIAETGACQSSVGCNFSLLPGPTPSILACSTSPNDPCQIAAGISSNVYVPETLNSLQLNPTIFHRKITITPTATSEEAQATVVVTWQQGLSTQSITLEEYLYSW